METILFLSPTEAESPLSKSALEALATTKQLAGSLGTTFSVGLWGEDPKAADGIASCGAAKFLAVTGVEFAQPRYATDAAAAEALVQAGWLLEEARPALLAHGGQIWDEIMK